MYSQNMVEETQFRQNIGQTYDMVDFVKLLQRPVSEGNRHRSLEASTLFYGHIFLVLRTCISNLSNTVIVCA